LRSVYSFCTVLEKAVPKWKTELAETSVYAEKKLLEKSPKELRAILKKLESELKAW